MEQIGVSDKNSDIGHNVHTLHVKKPKKSPKTTNVRETATSGDSLSLSIPDMWSIHLNI